MHTVDATRAVLSIIAHDVSFIKPSGRNSSKPRAIGFNNKAYLVVIKDEATPQKIRTIEIKCYSLIKIRTTEIKIKDEATPQKTKILRF
jgi:hypothetical protein